MSNLASSQFLIHSDTESLLRFVDNHQYLLDRIARDHQISNRALRLQVLLHLPRLISQESWPSLRAVDSEANRLARIIADRVGPYRSWLGAPTEPISSPRSLVFERLPEAPALVFHERFHYLASARSGSMHFGLTTPGEQRVVAMLSLSKFDLWHFVGILPKQLDPSKILVVSRVYAHDWAPRNCISFLISKVIDEIRGADTSMTLLVTYVNPNLDFTGASLRASNWRILAFEAGTYYSYLDGTYITDRKLKARFGTSDPDTLQLMLGDRFKTSEMNLSPLVIFGFCIDKELHAHCRDVPIRQVWRS